MCVDALLDIVLRLRTGKRQRISLGQVVTIRKRKFEGLPITTAFRKRARTAAAAGGYARRRRGAAWRMNRRQGGFLAIEKKFYDTTLTATTINAPTDSTTGEYDPSVTSMISTPAQGDGEQNRDGKQIIAKYVQLKGAITLTPQLNQTALDAGTRVFVALVLDTQSNGAQAQSEQVFKNLGAAAPLAASPLRNLENGARFKILKSETCHLIAKTASWDGTNIEVAGDNYTLDWYVPLNNLKINFNSGTTASIANVLDNSLHVMAFATVADCAIQYNARMRFVG